jgi:SWI/SNF-related matrix-associated actin-dependent regulator of chromatin subfamily B protein 1
MKHSAVDPATGQPVPANESTRHLPHKYLPRIKCLDCPGKLYTPGPGEGVENFEVHLKIRKHRDEVEARLAKEGGS